MLEPRLIADRCLRWCIPAFFCIRCCARLLCLPPEYYLLDLDLFYFQWKIIIAFEVPHVWCVPVCAHARKKNVIIVLTYARIKALHRLLMLFRLWLSACAVNRYLLYADFIIQHEPYSHRFQPNQFVQFVGTCSGTNRTVRYPRRNSCEHNTHKNRITCRTQQHLSQKNKKPHTRVFGYEKIERRLVQGGTREQGKNGSKQNWYRMEQNIIQNVSCAQCISHINSRCCSHKNNNCIPNTHFKRDGLFFAWEMYVLFTLSLTQHPSVRAHSQRRTEPFCLHSNWININTQFYDTCCFLFINLGKWRSLRARDTLQQK